MNKPNKSWFDWQASLWLLGAILILALRLVSTNWSEDLYIFIFLSLLATLLGILLGFSQLSDLAAAVCAIGYGAVVVPWLFGLTLDRDISWYNRIVNILWFRLRITYTQFVSNEPVTDTILFVAILAAVFWIVNLLAGYILMRRGSTWGALLPSGVALMVITYYDQANAQPANYLIFFLFFFFLLLGRMNFLHNQARWKTERIITTPQIQQDMRRTLLIAVTGIIVLVWLIPLTPTQADRYATLWKNLTQPFENFQKRFSRIVEPVEYILTEEDEGFGISLNLGRGANLGTSLVFTISSSQDKTLDIRNYWKAMNYDVYNNDQWYITSNYETIRLFPQDFEGLQVNFLSREDITYTFDMNASFKQNVFYVNATDWISRPVVAYLVESSEGDQDAFTFIANPPLQSGEVYQVKALVSNPTRVELRNSGSTYPDWVQSYLQLPTDLPIEIKLLAEEITAGQDNPFDKTQAITRYLRQNITYSETIPAVPIGRDPIEWFLFSHKSGFCNYYATAQVLMLRSIGIPARLAVGYAQGQYDETTELYSVVQRNRHAWPEVYFNEYGWIEFEPTTSEPAIERPIGEIDIIINEPTNLPQIDGEDTPTPFPLTPMPLPTQIPVNIEAVKTKDPIFGLWLGILLLTLLISVIIYWLATPQLRITPLFLLIQRIFEASKIKSPAWLEKFALRQANIPFKKAYAVLENSIKALGETISPADTPTERAERLIKLLPDCTDQIRELAHQYELAKFSPHQADIQKANECSLIIHKCVQVVVINKRLGKF